MSPEDLNSFKKKNIKTIAVTGGIGSGKSYVIKLFSCLYEVYTLSCDEVYKKISKKRWFLKQIRAVFPFAVKGKLFLRLDRIALSEKVFSDAIARKQLNEITHKLILNECFRIAEKVGKKPRYRFCVIEVPLLFESGYQDKFDRVLVVMREKETRIKSVMQRSNLTREQVVKRIEAQVDYDTMDLSKYTVLYNDCNFEENLKKVYIDLFSKRIGMSH